MRGAAHEASGAKGSDVFIERLLDRHSQQPRRVLLPVSLTALVMAGICATAVPSVWVFGWLALVALVLVIRLRVVGSLNQPKGRTSRQRLQIAVRLMMLSGIVHALSLFSFAYLPPFERALLSMLLVGLSAGCIATASGYPPLFRAYAVATLGPLAVLWALSPAPEGVRWIQSVMAIIMVLFGFAFDLLARDTFRLFKESYDYRLELQAALDQAEKASRAKTRFLASASHDLRQPMQTLSLFAAALAMRPLDERSREITHHMNDALHDLTSELDALLDISKLDAGVVRVEPAVFQLAAILNRILAIYAPIAEQRRVQLCSECPPTLQLEVDRKLFERIVRNLVENAIKYTDAGGAVRIRGHSEQGECILSVEDTGRGIPESEQERVFEEFYQLNNAERDRSRGLGLGLAIVRRLTELMNIDLTLRSTPNVGSVFELRINMGCGRVVDQEGSVITAADLSGLHVLVVDDEESVRLGMRSMLEAMGCRVSLACDTQEAVHCARQSRLDILVADFRLRGMDSGLQTIREVRTLHPHLPALLVSGDIAPDRLREAQDANVPILHKPVGTQLLLNEIRGLTQNNKRGSDHGDAPGEALSALDLSRI